MARKEFEDGQPVVCIYLAMEQPSRDHLDARLHEALKALDKDYANLESMLDMNPLRLRYLPMGTFARYTQMREAEGGDMAHMKPSHMQPSDEVVNRILLLAQD